MVLMSDQARMYDISISSAAWLMEPVRPMCASKSILPGPTAIRGPAATRQRGCGANSGGRLEDLPTRKSLQRPGVVAIENHQGKSSARPPAPRPTTNLCDEFILPEGPKLRY